MLFNIVGWIWKKTRKIHLATLFLTLFSWTILGIWYGFGYCFCTEWHWQVRAMLGNYPTETGYIQFLVNQLTGLSVSYQLTNDVTIVVMSLIVTASLSLNSIDFVRWYKKRKRKKDLP